MNDVYAGPMHAEGIRVLDEDLIKHWAVSCYRQDDWAQHCRQAAAGGAE